MARGFLGTEDFSFTIGWELYEVAFNKHHVMFRFSTHYLLNVAHSFGLRAPDNSVDYRYEIYGPNRSAIVEPILAEKVASASVRSIEQLDLVFANGFILSVLDDPDTRSWWFLDTNGVRGFPEDIDVEALDAREYRGTNPVYGFDND